MPPWESIEGDELRQGDFLPRCRVLVLTDPLPENPGVIDGEIGTRDLIVLTHSCDLLNPPGPRTVTLCAIGTVEEFEGVNPHMGRDGRWGKAAQGSMPGLHLIASPMDPGNGRAALVVDFRETFALPTTYLRHHAAGIGRRWRVVPPYLEQLSRAFGDYFSRVGVPAQVPRP
jgi:hypothetical protein